VFHEDFEFGILECGDSDRTNLASERGRIIATGFSNYAMPFIRYDVGDIGVWTNGTCACGRHSAILTSVDGRVEDFVLTPEGRKVLRFDYVFKDAANVRDAQVVQRQLGSICLRIVRRPAYSSSDENALRLEIKNRVSSRLIVEFEYVDEIEREANGKMRAVQSLIREPVPESIIHTSVN
jgi:phenylacetate-CoA ligase